MNNIGTLRLFARVARLGSFSAAARETGVGQSKVSRLIADLETQLGARLLVRSTRMVVPTEAGVEFLSQLEPILVALDEAEQRVRGASEFRGRLRISMPASAGARELIPRLAPFFARYPSLQPQVLLDDRHQDPFRNAVDIAFRVGGQGIAMSSRVIARIPRVVVASPQYVAAFGAPAAPTALGYHQIIRGPAAATARAWTFEREGETLVIDPTPAISVEESEGAIAFAVSGLGMTSVSLWSCRREIETGILVCLLTDWSMPDIPVYACLPMGNATRRSAHAAVEHLIEAFADIGKIAGPE